MTIGLAARLVAVRIGILSDLHGNSVALDAVLADAERQQVDRWLVLGDLVALGHDPVACSSG